MTTKRRPLRKARRALLTASLLSACITVLMLWIPVFALQLLEAAVPAGSLELLAVLGGISAAVLLVVAVLDFCRELVLLRAGLWLDHNMGAEALERGIVDGTAEGTLQGRFRAIVNVRAGLTNGSLSAIIELPWAIAACALVGLLHPALALACAGVLAVMVIAHLVLVGGRAPAPAADADAERWRSIAVREAVSLRAAGLASALARNWDLANRRWISRYYRHCLRQGLAAALARAFAGAGLLAVMAAAAYFAIFDGLALGAAVATVLLMARALGTFEQSIRNWHHFRAMRAAWRTLAAADRVTAPDGLVAEQLWNGPGRIVLENVVCRHPGAERPAIAGVSLVIEPGVCVGIFGSAGSGKSTLAAAIAGFIVPEAGRAEIDGEPIDMRQRSSSRPPIGFMPDAPALLPGSVHDNIGGFSAESGVAVVHAASTAGVHDLLVELPMGYETQVGEDGRALSLRQRRAVALARAVFGERRVVVLDQPELGLDEAGIANLLGSLMVLRSAGIGLVIATSDTRLLQITDRIVVLAGGRIESILPRNHVLEHPPASERWAA